VFFFCQKWTSKGEITMEITAIITDLNQKISDNSKNIPALEQKVAELRTALAKSEAELQKRTDELTAFRMALESLEMLGQPPVEIPKVQTVMTPAPVQHVKLSRGPKRIVKISAVGKQIGEYRSINQCAKDLGWTAPGVRKFIENIGSDKQLRMKGFILRYEKK